jgi:hypothetical protein
MNLFHGVIVMTRQRVLHTRWPSARIIEFEMNTVVDRLLIRMECKVVDDQRPSRVALWAQYHSSKRYKLGN